MPRSNMQEKKNNSEKRQFVEELHAPARRNFPRRRVIVHGYDDMWQADVVEMRPYARVNKGFTYILTVIDVLSKYSWAIPLKTKFKVGDSIRLSKFKTIFDKGYRPNWSTEVFKIIKIQKTNPATYLLEDSRRNPVAGGFYEYELHNVANPDVYLVEKVIRKKGDKVFAKWLGFDKSHNF
ncbi:uncharacterized protein [Anoplolepis gracilipes]|uniref:uncharacterized protein n=1 Tax=Anoplolepis gracilipes TaxID=354296 RepID=UPI003BA30DF6